MSVKKSKSRADTFVLAYKFVGYPTKEAESQLLQNIGGSRFIWNRMLSDCNKHYEETKEFQILSPADYKKEPGLEWMKNIDSLALCNVKLNLESAFDSFFKHKCGKPSFKKKGKCRDSYTTNLSNSKKPNMTLEDNYLKLPKVKDPIELKLHRKIKPGGILKHCTVSHEYDGKWFFSLTFEYPKEEIKASDPKDTDFTHIGLDMSFPKLYVDSEGQSPEFMKAYKKAEKRLQFEMRKLSRKEGFRKGETPSNNFEKQKKRVQSLYAKTKHQRQDMLHKISKSLTDQYDLISIEDLNIAGIKRSMHFGKTVSDLGWSNFTSMLQYKQERNGHYLVKINRFFPSSKTCSVCGHVHKELKLSDRTYICPECGNVMDRDLQAAVNIDREGLRILKNKIAA